MNLRDLFRVEPDHTQDVLRKALDIAWLTGEDKFDVIRNAERHALRLPFSVLDVLNMWHQATVFEINMTGKCKASRDRV